MAKISNRELNRLISLATRKGGVQKRRKSNKRRNGRKRAVVSDALVAKHTHHALSLANPSQSMIPSGVYDGEQGIINRFTQDYSIVGGATVTCLGLLFHPNTGYVQAFSATDSTVTVTAALAASSGVTPGFAHLNGSARKQRGIAASIRFSLPSVTFNTISGEVACGVISTDLLTVGSASFTGDQLFQYAAARAPVSRGVQEVKWYPGAFDNRYATWSTSSFSATGSDSSDTNLVYVVYRGIPVNTSSSVKLDWVCEWVPRFGSGFTPSFNTKAGIDHMKTVEHLHAHKPGWFHNLTGELEAGAAALGIGGLASKFIKGSKSFASRVGSSPIIEEVEEIAPLMLTL